MLEMKQEFGVVIANMLNYNKQNFGKVKGDTIVYKGSNESIFFIKENDRR